MGLMNSYPTDNELGKAGSVTSVVKMDTLAGSV